MKYLKILGLAAVAAMALMAFAGTASATELYSGATTLGKGTLIKASLEGSSVLSSGETVLNTCTGGQFTSEITNPGSATTTTSGPNITIDFENCANPVHTIKTGTLEVHHIAGTDNGTVTASGAEIGNTIFGTNCVYASNTGLHLGTLTGATKAGEDAILHVDATVSEVGGRFLCPDTATWTATFRVTSPTPLHVAAS
jgi:hypothetical protein